MHEQRSGSGRRRDARRPAATLAALALTGCAGADSTLNPAGTEAETIAQLFRIMAIGATAIWAAVIGVALYAALRPDRAHGRRTTRWLILGGGAIAPTLVLGVLLLYGLVLMPQLRQPVGDDGLRVAVSGEQWWWRVRYFPADGAGAGQGIALANEIRLPVGERVRFTLTSPDVIHSFWIPALGGKLDMIPGHRTTLVLQSTRTGVFRGACAEYCGTSHAYMQFVVVVMEREAFARWLRWQAAPALAPRGALARRGQQAFGRNGCGACHAVRGTAADGVVGPDLTHVGSRASLGAGILPNDVHAFDRWITDTHAVKPDVLMPSFGMLPDDELHAIAAYLEGLR